MAQRYRLRTRRGRRRARPSRGSRRASLHRAARHPGLPHARAALDGRAVRAARAAPGPAGRRSTRVEVSADGGETWADAELERDVARPWAWCAWRYEWDAPAGRARALRPRARRGRQRAAARARRGTSAATATTPSTASSYTSPRDMAGVCELISETEQGSVRSVCLGRVRRDFFLLFINVRGVWRRSRRCCSCGSCRDALRRSGCRRYWRIRNSRFRYPGSLPLSGALPVSRRRTCSTRHALAFTWAYRELGLPSGETCRRRMDRSGSGAACSSGASVVLQEHADRGGRLDWSRVIVDASLVDAKKGATKVARSLQGRPGSRFHLAVDANGAPLAVRLRGRQRERAAASAAAH